MKYVCKLRLAQTTALLAISLAFTAPKALAKSETDVALVTSLSGNVSLVLDGSSGASHQPHQKSVKLYDWLPVGATMRLPAGAQATVTFIDGKSYELSGLARVAITAAGPIASTGAVRELSSAAAPLNLPGIKNVRMTESGGAVRIRTGIDKIDDLYPSGSATSLPSQTTLRFSAVAGVESYQVAIQDKTGAEIFKSEVKAPEVVIPQGVLQPGREYYWTVSASTLQGKEFFGAADFSTLKSEQIEERSAWQKAWEGSKNPSLLAAMAEIDYRLGLLAESREELHAAEEIEPKPSPQQ